jgi:hypothetical protein
VIIRQIAAALAVGAAGCASADGGLFSLGPRPVELAGVWIDSVKTTTSDSSMWVLTPRGADRMLRIHIVTEASGAMRIRRDDTRYGSWYLAGALADTAKRTLCVKRRPRDGASCMRFRLDTISSDHISRRRVTILEYRGDRTTSDRVLLERFP